MREEWKPKVHDFFYGDNITLSDTCPSREKRYTFVLEVEREESYLS
jgi:hypothetical protein